MSSTETCIKVSFETNGFRHVPIKEHCPFRLSHKTTIFSLFALSISPTRKANKRESHSSTTSTNTVAIGKNGGAAAASGPVDPSQDKQPATHVRVTQQNNLSVSVERRQYARTVFALVGRPPYNPTHNILSFFDTPQVFNTHWAFLTTLSIQRIGNMRESVTGHCLVCQNVTEKYFYRVSYSALLSIIQSSAGLKTFTISLVWENNIKL